MTVFASGFRRYVTSVLPIDYADDHADLRFEQPVATRMTKWFQIL
jgi:hypothetical protein